MNPIEIKVTGRVLGFSKDVMRLSPDVFGSGETTLATPPADPSAAPVARPAQLVRQNSKPKMNNLEREWFDRIKGMYPNYPPVRDHAKTFLLCNGVRYTPDASCSSWPHPEGCRETCWEVKGKHAWDDAIVKIKMAAHEFPEICWRLVWKVESEWCEQIMLP